MNNSTPLINYIRAVFNEYRHANNICPMNHEEVDFYFGKIYINTNTPDSAPHYEDHPDLIADARQLHEQQAELHYIKGYSFINR